MILLSKGYTLIMYLPVIVYILHKSDTNYFKYFGEWRLTIALLKLV